MSTHHKSMWHMRKPRYCAVGGVMIELVGLLSQGHLTGDSNAAGAGIRADSVATPYGLAGMNPLYAQRCEGRNKSSGLHPPDCGEWSTLIHTSSCLAGDRPLGALHGLGVAQQDVYKYKPTKEDLYAYQMAGITNKDVDFLITYDAFSPMVLFGLERFGFCGPGEAKDFIKDGRIELGGELPVNTSGGLLSEGHVVGWNLFIEAVRQLRHECGPRQVKDAEIAQYACFLGESIIFRR